MKKNRGFTLIELLAVIVILGILISISSVAVNSLRKKQEKKNMENVISSILTGAKEYNAENKINGSVTVDELRKGNYTDFDVNKYGYLRSISVQKVPCGDNRLKIRYEITANGTTYNDCGCEKQDETVKSNEICTN